MTAKQKRKTTRPPPSATTSPVLNANEEPSSTNPDIDPFNPFTLKHEDQEGDDTAPGSSTKSKKPLSSASASAVAPAAAPTPTPPPASAASTGKKTSAPVSSSSSTSKNATSTTAPRSKDKNLSASLKVEDEEEQVQEGQEEDAAPPPPPRPVEKRGSARAATRPQTKKPVVEEPEEESEEEEEDDEEGGDGGVTRCVCDEDTEEMASGLMIQCDTCKCWQHGQCVGLWNEKDCPDRYFCEQCRPGWHGPGGLLRKAHRKSAPTVNRSPSVTSSSRNKPRESADAALVSAFLAAENSVHPDARATQSRSPSPPPKPKSVEPVAKKRSTMNSRDAAYDDAIAMSILGPGSAAMRARLEKARNGSASGASGAGDEEDEEEEKVEKEEQEERDRKKKKTTKDHKRTKSKDVARDELVLDDDADAGDDGPTSKRRKVSPDLTAGDAEPSATQDDAKMDVEEEEKPIADEAACEPAAEVVANGAEPEEIEVRDPTPPPAAAAPTKAKHPNQYTYRPKNGAATARPPRASPVKRGASNKEKKDTDRDFHGAANVPSATSGAAVDLMRSQRARDWAPSEAGGWGMPEHLKHLSHLLPTPLPTPLSVPVAPTLADDGVTINATRTETPTKVRFPNKRMTMPEMKKRARNVLDYLARIQVEMAERERRSSNGDSGNGSSSSGSGTPNGGAATTSAAKVETTSESLRMMDDLTKDVIMFQQKFFSLD